MKSWSVKAKFESSHITKEKRSIKLKSKHVDF